MSWFTVLRLSSQKTFVEKFSARFRFAPSRCLAFAKYVLRQFQICKQACNCNFLSPEFFSMIFKIFQGFSLFSYQGSLFCRYQRQLLYCIRCLIACQQLFQFIFCFHRDSHRFMSCLTSQLSYNIMQSNHCQQQISFFCIFFFQQSNWLIMAPKICWMYLFSHMYIEVAF